MGRLFLGGLLLAVMALQAQAQQVQAQQPQAQQPGGALPRDVADGAYVTLEEVRANSRDTFEAFAGEGAEAVTRMKFIQTELSDGVGPAGSDSGLLEKLFGELDADGDGLLTLDEWNRQIESDLAFADENEDGRVTLKELANARENMGIGDALGMIF